MDTLFWEEEMETLPRAGLESIQLRRLRLSCGETFAPQALAVDAISKGDRARDLAQPRERRRAVMQFVALL